MTVYDTQIGQRGQMQRSRTAEIVCALRALETRRSGDRRLIDDPYAQRFITTGAYRLLCSNRSTAALTRAGFDRLYPGYLAIVLLRNRRHEELIAESVAAGIRQIVLLGAGFDSTALRLDVGDAALYEVDAGPTQRLKRAVLERTGLTPRNDARYVQCDFERDSLPDRLLSHGFDRHSQTLVVWWGVSFFLSDDAVRATLADVASLMAPGSRFAFDYLDASVVDGSTTYAGARRARAAVIRRGEPYRFGLTPDAATEFVNSFGLAVEENLSVQQLAKRYAPFPYSTDDFFGVITARRVTR